MPSLVFLVALGIACSRARAPTEQLASRPATTLASRPKRPANLGKARPEPLETPHRNPRLDEDCTAGLDASPGLENMLAELERQCVASMRPLLAEPALAELTEGTSAGVSFALTDPTGCVRVAAAAEPGLAELELTIVDPEGAPHAARVQAGPFALVGPEGPICFDQAGQYRVELRSRRGGGRVAVNVWTAR